VSATPAVARDHASRLRYLPGIDGLRAISVLAVLVFHHYFIGGGEAGWLPGGFLGVEVFFVVSGYLITSLLLAERRETGTVSLPNFWLRRARRLLPALWVMLAVVIGYSLLLPLNDSIGTLRSDTLAALTYTSNWWQIAAHRSYFAAAGRQPLLTHLWSLAIEEQFYLIWPPLLLLGLRRIGREKVMITTLCIALTSALLCSVVANYSVTHAYYATYCRLSGLLLGSLLAFVYAPYRIRGIPGHGVRIALDIVGTIGLVVLLGTFGFFGFIGIHGFSWPTSSADSVSVFHYGFLLVDLATLLVIAAAVHPSSDLGAILGWRPLRWIGLRSYGIYLWHYPIFCVTRPRLDFDEFFHLAGWPVFVLRLGLTFGAAALSYRYVEQPIRRGALTRYWERMRAAHGERRARLARRAVLVAGSCTLIVVMLGAGLASAHPRNEVIPGINEAAHSNDNGSAADPSAVAELSGHATTTTLPRHRRATRPKGPTLPTHVLSIGDSVMLGARSSLQTTIPGIAVDASVSRQFWQAILVVAYYVQHGLEPPVVVIHSGTNGRITDGMFDTMMRTIGPGHQVYFLTARVPRWWESEVNSTLRNGVKRWKNAHLVDWRSYSGCHDDWFVHDGFHLTTVGQQAYASLVKAGLLGDAPTKCT
jgi:peptidoglycan/LPS O-acetylase OafA/YrhL